MSGLYLVADDLTGALDSAASFCGRLGPIPVYLGAPHEAAGLHAAVDLATRDADATVAIQATLGVIHQLSSAGIAFKKIDSLLRGQWPVELAAILHSGAFQTCVFAPAFPAQGRTTVAGRQLVRAADGSSLAIEANPVDLLRRLGLNAIAVSGLGRDGRACRHVADAAVVIADATSDQDLRAIVRWGLQRDKPVLWCGSAGLAHALAQGDPPRIATVGQPVLAIVGTDHAVTKVQVAHAAARVPARCVVAGDDAAESASRVARAMSRSGSCVLTFEMPSGISAAQAAAMIRDRLGNLLPRITPPSTLLVTGGETLLGVCRALGATHLEVDGELGPGVPHSRLCAGLWSGVDVVSKSGAFGPPHWLDDLLATAR